jgi:2-keto-3-deoxy-L-fuconate dehydrogenase
MVLTMVRGRHTLCTLRCRRVFAWRIWVDQFRLDGKRMVLTGGASGIGRAVASVFVEAGATVALVDLNAESVAKAAAELGERAKGYACDVSDEAGVVRTFRAIAADGAIDGLVNSAGVSHIGSLLTTAAAEFDRLFAVNVRGTYLCMKNAVEVMKAGGGGVIVNLASIAATAGLEDRFAYSMTKGAVLSMTLSVARDYLADGIRCNCISPARVHTAFVDNFVARSYAGREAEMYAKLSASQPIGRMGKPEEIALMALYLCSDAAGFITGSDMPIDGGFMTLR